MTKADGKVLEIQRRFRVGRSALFQAWTDPQALKAWFGPEGVVTQVAEVDLQVGGEYRIEMLLPSGNRVTHWGVYHEIVPPEKLVFTWILDDQGGHGSDSGPLETLVTIRFRALGEHQTELRLAHERLPTPAARDGHKSGWNGSFDCLHRHVSRKNNQPGQVRSDPGQ